MVSVAGDGGLFVYLSDSVAGVQLVRDSRVILTGHLAANSVLHQTRERWENLPSENGDIQRRQHPLTPHHNTTRLLSVDSHRCAYVDGRVDASVVHLSIDKDLALCDVSREIRDGVSDVIVRHRQNGDLWAVKKSWGREVYTRRTCVIDPLASSTRPARS